jgi:hypothetical protein
MQLFCRIFGHRRSRRRARPFAGRWRSRCSRCGTDLVRLAPGEWQVAERSSFATGCTFKTLPRLDDAEADTHRSQPRTARPPGQADASQDARKRHVRWTRSGKELRIAFNDDNLVERLQDRLPIKLQASREVQIGIFIGRLDELDSQSG